MNQIQLYINDQLVDLTDDSPIALTFQINNLAEVKNQQGNTSNQFKLPLTQRNRQILGFPDDIAFASTLPYDNYQAKIIQDGLEIIPYGLAVLNSIEQDMANITILSGNVDFFDAIDGKIYDMGDSTSQWTNFGKTLLWQLYDHKWNVQNVVTSQTNTGGWIWPVVDYGFIGEVDFTEPINVRNQRPGFFIKTAIDLIIKSAGYKAKGSLLNNPLYPLLICQFANDSFEHGTDLQNAVDGLGQSASLSYTSTSDIVLDGDPLGLNAHDPTDITMPIGFQEYHATQAIHGTASVIFDMTMAGIAGTGNDGYFELFINYRDVNGIESQQEAIRLNFDQKSTPPGARDRFEEFKNIKITHDFELVKGESLFVSFHLHRYNTRVIIKKGAKFQFVADQKPVLYGQEIQCERIFPDISQKDLLKDTLQRFGIVCQTDNSTKTISFNSFADIVANIPVAKNWTGKCIDQGKTISFQLGGYAQTNYMKYKEDDNIIPKDFANAQITVPDKTLPATADLFESQFAPTFNRPYIGGTIVQIKKADTTGDDESFSISTSPRILVDQKIDLRNYGDNTSIKFTDGDAANDITVNDIISVPYFYKPDGNYNLCFKDMPGKTGMQPGLKTSYYPQLERILTQTKKVVRYFLLTPRDILELDLLIPVYLEQDSCYYYINKIDSWRKGQPTKVELVKLG
jgi:hypothetical protein